MNRLLQGNAICHAAHRVLAVKLLKLCWRVLVEELVKGEVTTTDFDLDLVTDATDPNALCAELVNTFGLTHKHDLELLSVRVVVDILSKLPVDSVVLDWDVHGDTRLQIDDVLAELFNLLVSLINLPLVLLHLLEHLQLHRLRLVELLLKLVDVRRSAFQLHLELALASFHAVVVGFPGVSLLLDIAFLGQDCVFLEDCAFKFDNRLLALSEADLKLTDLHFVVASLAFHLVLVLALHICHLICDLSFKCGHLVGVPRVLSFDLLDMLLALGRRLSL